MLTVTMEFKCKLCNQDERFYIMPEKLQVGSGKTDYIRSQNRYTIVCKECQKAYTLTVNIKAL